MTLYFKILREFQSDIDDPEDNNPDIYDKLNDHQMNLAQNLTNSVKKFKQFSQKFVLYTNQSTFGKENICSNCLFFRNEQNICGIVEKKIIADGGCRFFIIPGN